MVSFKLLSSKSIATELSERLKSRRLEQNLTQRGLSERSGVAFGTLKKFELTGQISLLSFIRLAVALKDEATLEGWLFAPKFETIEEALESKKKPKRGRIN